MNDNYFKIKHEELNYLEVHFWKNSKVYLIYLMIGVGFIVPFITIIPLQLNLITVIYYLLILGSFWSILGYWSSAHLIIILDLIKDEIRYSFGKPRSWIKILHLSDLLNIHINLKSSSQFTDESLEELINSIPYEERSYLIIFEFKDKKQISFGSFCQSNITNILILRNKLRSFIR